MIPRSPRITFENALPHWARNHAFAQITNAGSTSLPAVETYLNKVMLKAAQQISASALGTDIALFCAQEGNHYRQHRIFNKLLYAPYPQLAALEDELHADYARMLARDHSRPMPPTARASSPSASSTPSSSSSASPTCLRAPTSAWCACGGGISPRSSSTAPCASTS